MNAIRNHADIVSIERAFVGAAVIDPMVIDRMAVRMSAANFFDDQLGKLFALLVDRREAGLPNDIALIRDDAKNIYGDATSATLAELFSTLGLEVGNAPHYADRIIEESKLRRLAILGTDVAGMVKDATKSADEISTIVEGRLGCISTLTTGIATTSAHEAATELMRTLDDTTSSRRPVFTGIAVVDSVIGGLMPGELEIIAGRPGSGKTALALQIASELSYRLRPVLFVSLEMTNRELISRIVCGRAGVDSRMIRNGQATDAMKEKLNAECANLDGVPLVICDAPAATLTMIKAAAKMQKTKGGLDLLVVDYIGLVTARDRKIPRHEQVSEITAGLKQLAKELDVPVIALCQLNREAETSEPRLSHLRESGSIEQDADIVIFLHEDRHNEKYKLICGKHRHGEVGAFNVTFDKKRQRIS